MGLSAEQLAPIVIHHARHKLLTYPSLTNCAVPPDEDQLFARIERLRAPSSKPTIRMIGSFTTEDGTGNGMTVESKLVPTLRGHDNPNAARLGRGFAVVVNGEHSHVIDTDFQIQDSGLFNITYAGPVDILRHVDACILAYGHCVELEFDSVKACPLVLIRELFIPEEGKSYRLDKKITPMASYDLKYSQSPFSGWSHSGFDEDDLDESELVEESPTDYE